MEILDFGSDDAEKSMRGASVRGRAIAPVTSLVGRAIAPPISGWDLAPTPPRKDSSLPLLYKIFSNHCTQLEENSEPKKVERTMHFL